MRRFLTLVLLFLPLLYACDSDPTGTSNSHVGVYHLQSVNGNALPYTFVDADETITVNSGSITLNANGTVQVAIALEIDAETMNPTITGTYTRSGGTITTSLAGSDEGFETATIVGNTLTTTGGGGEVLVFQK